MSILKKIFSKEEKKKFNYADFWAWFTNNEKAFHKAIEKRTSIEKDFFEPLSENLAKIQEGFYFLTGMLEDGTADLIFTAEGNIKNFVFVEELIASAPKLDQWQFRAHKPSFEIDDFGISMNDYEFNINNIFFYSNANKGYPDLIDLTFVHNDFSNENKDVIIQGTYIFLDNFLGELNFATLIDELDFVSKDEAAAELVPVSKLKDFLNWRQKEFVEKYEGIRNDTENDKFSIFEASEDSEHPLIAVINRDLLSWDNKASHPWVMVVEIEYDGKDRNGMPSSQMAEHLNEIEEEILSSLKDSEGYLNIGRQTAQNIRKIYFANHDFRKPTKVLSAIIEKYNKDKISFDIYKDKYWQTFNRYG